MFQILCKLNCAVLKIPRGGGGRGPVWKGSLRTLPLVSALSGTEHRDSLFQKVGNTNKQAQMAALGKEQRRLYFTNTLSLFFGKLESPGQPVG